MSGAVSTVNPASRCGFSSSGTARPSSSTMARARVSDWLLVCRRARSSRIAPITGGCRDRRSPARKSSLFSRDRERRRLAVRGPLRQGVDRQAAQPAIGQRIGVDRQKQLGPEGARPRHPLAQRHESVAAARQHGAIAAAGVEQARQLARRRQRHRLFVEPVRADRAGIHPAVSRIERDDPRLRRGCRGPARASRAPPPDRQPRRRCRTRRPTRAASAGRPSCPA